ncbi:MAG: FAD-dependent monooxygenase [Pseudonocardiaceae bacterium]
MEAPVIVVGAGPTGLMLAGELRLAGIEVIVIERLPAPTGESRGLGFTARAMEVFDQRGLLPRFGDIGTSVAGHFGGLPVDFSSFDGAHFGVRGVPQARTEAILAQWATELGADIRRGWELVGLVADEHGVDAQVQGPDGPARLRASYMVGCDGGRSTVRRAAGFDFLGTAAAREMFLADVAGCNLRTRFIGEKVPGGMVMAAPLGDDVDRIIVCERGTLPRRRTEAPSFTEVADAWQRLTGEDIRDGVCLWVSAFTDATRQATEYRRGRVLLAGDAAHIHLPAGGQGLSVGVQDSANLGWKLAAVVHGWAPPGLLDTYHSERYPVGALLLRNTQAQGMLYLSGDEVQPLRDVMADLIELKSVSRHLAGVVSGLDIRYDVGSGDHPLLGLRMPHQDLAIGERAASTTQLLHAARGVLLDFAGNSELRHTASGWADRIDIVTATPRMGAAGQLASTEAILLRPDGHVAWAAPGGGELAAALHRWFGFSHSRRDRKQAGAICL